MKKLLYVLFAMVVVSMASCSEDEPELVVCPLLPEAIESVKVMGSVEYDAIIQKKVLSADSVENTIYPKNFTLIYILPDSLTGISEGELLECSVSASEVRRENGRIYFAVLEIESISLGSENMHVAACGTDEYINVDAFRTYTLSRAAMSRKAINVFIHVVRDCLNFID